MRVSEDQRAGVSVWDWLLIPAGVIGSSNNMGGYQNSCSKLLMESLISAALKTADEETLLSVSYGSILAI